MWLRIGVTVLLLLWAVGPFIALTSAKTPQERRAPLGRLLFFVAFALAVLISAWSPGIAFALLLLAGVAGVTDAVVAARQLRRGAE